MDETQTGEEEGSREGTQGIITPAVDTKDQEAWGGGPELNEGPSDPPRIVKDQERDLEHPTTNCETLIHVLKGNLGTGLLAMPEAFMNAGLWVGLVGVPFLGLICIHCMHTLLKCSKELCERTGASALSYEETAKMAFTAGPPKVRKWAGTVDYVITTFLIITQVGFCCVYFVFIPQNLQQAIQCMTGYDKISSVGYMALLIIPLLLICYIPELKYLAPLSLIAGLLQIVGLAITFYYMIRDLPTEGPGVEAWAGWSTLPLYFGATIFSFEGIGLVLPLENKMLTPVAFGGLTGVLNTAMVIVVCLYSGMGFFGYLTYGTDIQGSITLNLPPTEGLGQAVKILMAVSVYLTYPLQMYVPYEIAIPFITRRFFSTLYKALAEYTFRTLMVLLTFVLAVAIPNIGLFISLVGAVSSSALAIIFPPIIELVTFWPNTGRYHWVAIKGTLICLFGLLGFLTGTFTSIQAIVDYFGEGGHTEGFTC